MGVGVFKLPGSTKAPGYSPGLRPHYRISSLRRCAESSLSCRRLLIMSAALTLEEQAGDRLDNDAYELEFGCQQLSLGHPLNIFKDDIVGRLVFFWKQSIDLLILNSPQRFNCIDDFRVELDNLQLYQSETHLMQIIPFVPLKVEKALCQFTDIDLADSFCVGVVFLRLTKPREYAKPIKPFEYHLGELHSQRQQLLHLATVEDLGFLFGG